MMRHKLHFLIQTGARADLLTLPIAHYGLHHLLPLPSGRTNAMDASFSQVERQAQLIANWLHQSKSKLNSGSNSDAEREKIPPTASNHTKTHTLTLPRPETRSRSEGVGFIVQYLRRTRNLSLTAQIGLEANLITKLVPLFFYLGP